MTILIFTRPFAGNLGQKILSSLRWRQKWGPNTGTCQMSHKKSWNKTFWLGYDVKRNQCQNPSLGCHSTYVIGERCLLASNTPRWWPLNRFFWKLEARALDSHPLNLIAPLVLFSPNKLKVPLHLVVWARSRLTAGCLWLPSPPRTVQNAAPSI